VEGFDLEVRVGVDLRAPGPPSPKLGPWQGPSVFFLFILFWRTHEYFRPGHMPGEHGLYPAGPYSQNTARDSWCRCHISEKIIYMAVYNEKNVDRA